MKKLILRRLINKRKIGGSHTALINLSKGFPSHFSSTKKGKKLIEKAIKELINDNLLLAKQSTNEKHVSVNPRKSKEIQILLGINSF
ncbi:hypothetical protein KJ660_00695 [Candidatus Micrarchaeota archaeon]|nr:hypothetical protein [Candidatus Micrarchaeota archaeon]